MHSAYLQAAVVTRLLWYLSHIKLLTHNQSAMKCWCILSKIVRKGAVLMNSCQSVFGVWFFLNTVQYCVMFA